MTNILNKFIQTYRFANETFVVAKFAKKLRKVIKKVYGEKVIKKL